MSSIPYSKRQDYLRLYYRLKYKSIHIDKSLYDRLNKIKKDHDITFNNLLSVLVEFKEKYPLLFAELIKKD